MYKYLGIGFLEANGDGSFAIEPLQSDNLALTAATEIMSYIERDFHKEVDHGSLQELSSYLDSDLVEPLNLKVYFKNTTQVITTINFKHGSKPYFSDAYGTKIYFTYTDLDLTKRVNAIHGQTGDLLDALNQAQNEALNWITSQV